MAHAISYASSRKPPPSHGYPNMWGATNIVVMTVVPAISESCCAPYLKESATYCENVPTAITRASNPTAAYKLDLLGHAPAIPPDLISTKR
jgi:hypothetical protein